MGQFIGCDAHKKYSVFVSVNEAGQFGHSVRVAHERESYRQFLATLPPGSPIAVETTGNWYWMVEEMEQAGHVPLLADAATAKARMGHRNKTDKLDARGLAELLRMGTLPAVWIPPAELRDQRELVRLRMWLVQQRTRSKNRIHGILSHYALGVPEASDLFGRLGREWLAGRLDRLPSETRHSIEQQLELLDTLEAHIQATELRIEQMIQVTPDARRLQTEPGIGKILSLVILLHTGDVQRFPSAGHYASYAGLVPRVESSGGRTWLGPTRSDVNQYLKWAFTEAANVVVLHSKRKYAGTHVAGLYRRVRNKTGLHGKAVIAVARHLAEAAYWILRKAEPYQEPSLRRWLRKVSSNAPVSAANF